VIDTPSRLRLIRKTVALARIFPTLDLIIEEKVAWWKWNVYYYESRKCHWSLGFVRRIIVPCCFKTESDFFSF
jgi:hypothetical protein